MSLSPYQQFQRLIHTSESILILLPRFAHGDAISSALSLAHLLEKNEKTVTIASDTIHKSLAPLAFLPQAGSFVETLFGTRDFLISFNTTYNKITAIRSEQDDDEYRIFITPEKGSIDPRDFSFIPANYKFQLVITLDTPDKESLGKLFQDNADIFYEVPVINIDHHLANENYGTLNIIDVTASSTAEIIADITRTLYEDFFDDAIAECLLAGVMSATDSFQNKSTTPKSLQLASWLMDHGAKQQVIVTHLYKTQPLHLLKLWGRAMSSMSFESQSNLVWSVLTSEDFAVSGTMPDDVPTVLEKIKSYYSSGAFFLIFIQETNAPLKGILRAAKPEALPLLAPLWKTSEMLDGVLAFIPEAPTPKEALAEFLAKISV
jgi:nanoRNase/pAp phosphatase (c-di-AMP/oligoRNAs hydrolase)